MVKQSCSCDACVASREGCDPHEATQASQLRALVTLLVIAMSPFPVCGEEPVKSPAPAEQTSQPTEATEDIEASMRRAFAELADARESVREAAHAKLMALPRRYLPSLRKHIEENGPLQPAQAVALRGIVKHVFLAGESYESRGEYGFLGVRLRATIVRMPPAPREPEREPEDGAEPELINVLSLPPKNGIVIVDRLPGFVGSRLLRDGDIVLSIADRPELEFPSENVFSEVVRESPPGKPVRFRVLRRGRVIEVPIPLDPRPDAADPVNTEEMVTLDNDRRVKAEEYWQKMFAALLKEGVG